LICKFWYTSTIRPENLRRKNQALLRHKIEVVGRQAGQGLIWPELPFLTELNRQSASAVSSAWANAENYVVPNNSGVNLRKLLVAFAKN
jgi:hypothetical protein